MPNEVSRRKSTSRSKLKATSQEERHWKWKEHFKHRLRNPPKITDNPTEKIINSQQIKLGHFTERELDAIKSGKVAGLDEILPELWITRKSDDKFF